MRMMPLLLSLALWSTPALAEGPVTAVGERHGQALRPGAGVRDAEQREHVRYTVWYPAQAGSHERALQIGPPQAPLFEVGRAADDAVPAAGTWPVLLLSHGNGGSARMMGWFGTAMARAGFLVIAVDHPGNNGVDAMTVAGSTLTWERAGDLKAALAAVHADPALSAHLDMARLGVAGYSAGGFTALLAAGARMDLQRLLDFCRAQPQDGVCQPQAEFPTLTLQARLDAAATPALQPYVRQAGDDHAIPGVRAVFLMAPAIVQAFAPTELEQVVQPVGIVAGERDTVAAPPTNADVAAASIPHATRLTLPGVGHYDFLSDCTPLGRQRLGPLCEVAVPRTQTHATTIDAATRFFRDTL
ncbi:alpha/beta hydrolase family protein [Stenotrophomonas nematodicola]|uniref:alpha/beta hydrolase family protein n=1 Tax=Stenotrophomonas nematodicola TaxID=2656746 RepID=UPI003D9A96C9